MPPGGASVHGEMIATIKKTAHQKFIVRRDGAAARRGRGALPQLDPDSDAYRTVTVTRPRLSRRRGASPAEFVAEQAQAVSAAQHAWIEARSRSDYAHFQPHLEKHHRPQEALHRLLPAGRASVRHPARRLRARRHDGRRHGALRDDQTAAGGADSRNCRATAGGRRLPAACRIPSASCGRSAKT